MEFKCCDKEDVKRLYDLRKQSILRYEDPTIINIKDALETMLTSLQGSYEGYIKIIDDGNIIGYYHLSEGLDFVYDLTFFYIEKEYRRQGYGKKILKYLQNKVDDRIQIQVYMKNTDLIDFLEANYFHIKRIISKSQMILTYP